MAEQVKGVVNPDVEFNRKKLYEELTKTAEINEYDQFYKDLEDDEYRHQVFDYVKSKGDVFKIGGDYDRFWYKFGYETEGFKRRKQAQIAMDGGGVLGLEHNYSVRPEGNGNDNGNDNGGTLGTVGSLGSGGSLGQGVENGGAGTGSGVAVGNSQVGEERFVDEDEADLNAYADKVNAGIEQQMRQYEQDAKRLEEDAKALDARRNSIASEDELKAYNNEVAAWNNRREALVKRGQEFEGLAESKRAEIEEYNRNRILPSTKRYGNGRGWSYADMEEMERLKAAYDAARSEVEATSDSLKNGGHNDLNKVRKSEEAHAHLKAAKQNLAQYASRFMDGYDEEAAVKMVSEHQADMAEKQYRPEVKRQMDAIDKIIADVKPARDEEYRKYWEANKHNGHVNVQDLVDNTEAGKQHNMAEAAKRLLESSEQTLQNYRTVQGQRGGGEMRQLGYFGKNTLRGFGQKIADISTWDMGITDMRDAVALKEAVDKAEKGEELTTAEEALLNAAGMDIAIKCMLDTGMGFQGGEVMADAIPFMLDMMLAPEARVGNSIATRVVKTIMKRAVGLAEKGGMKAGMRYIGRNSGKLLSNLGKQELANLGRGAMMSFRPTQISTVVAGANDRMTGVVLGDFNENGEFVYTGIKDGTKADAAEAWLKAWGAQTKENASEMTGDTIFEAFGDFFGGMAKIAGKTATGKRLTSEFGQAATKMKNITPGFIKSFAEKATRMANSDFFTFVGKMKERAHMSGAIPETMEELWGGIYDAAFIGDQEWTTEEGEGVLDAKNAWETFVTMLPMQVMFGAIGIGGASVQKGRAMYKVRQARADMMRTMGRVQAESIEKLLGTFDDDTFGEKLSEAIKGLNMEQQQAVKVYALARQFERGLNMASNIEAAHDANAAMVEEARTSGQELFDDAMDGGNRAMRATAEMNMLTSQLMDMEDSKSGSVASQIASQILGMADEMSNEDVTGILNQIETAYNQGQIEAFERDTAQKFVIGQVRLSRTMELIDEENENRRNGIEAEVSSLTHRESGQVVRGVYGGEEVFVTEGQAGMAGAVSIRRNDGRPEIVDGSRVALSGVVAAAEETDRRLAEAGLLDGDVLVNGYREVEVGSKISSIETGEELTVTEINGDTVTAIDESGNTLTMSKDEADNNQLILAAQMHYGFSTKEFRNWYELNFGDGNAEQSSDDNGNGGSQEGTLGTAGSLGQGAYIPSELMGRFMNGEPIPMNDGRVIEHDATLDEGNKVGVVMQFPDGKTTSTTMTPQALEKVFETPQSPSEGASVAEREERDATEFPAAPEGGADIAEAGDARTSEERRKENEEKQKAFEKAKKGLLSALGGCRREGQIDRLLKEFADKGFETDAEIENAVENRKEDIAAEEEARNKSGQEEADNYVEDEEPHAGATQQKEGYDRMTAEEKEDADWENAKNDWFKARERMTLSARLDEVRAAGISPETSDETVIGLFAVAEGFQVDPDSLRDELGGNHDFFGEGWGKFIKKGTGTLSGVAHNAYHDANGYERGLSDAEIKNAIINGVLEGGSRKAVEALERMAGIGSQWSDENSPSYARGLKHAEEENARRQQAQEEERQASADDFTGEDVPHVTEAGPTQQSEEDNAFEDASEEEEKTAEQGNNNGKTALGKKDESEGASHEGSAGETAGTEAGRRAVRGRKRLAANATREQAEAFYTEKFGGDEQKVEDAMAAWDLLNKSRKRLSNVLGFKNRDAQPLTRQEQNTLINLLANVGYDFIVDESPKFGDFFFEMVSTFGDNVRPYVARVYGSIREQVPDEIYQQMDSSDYTRSFDTNMSEEEYYNDNENDNAEQGSDENDNENDNENESEQTALPGGEPEGGDRDADGQPEASDGGNDGERTDTGTGGERGNGARPEGGSGSRGGRGRGRNGESSEPGRDTDPGAEAGDGRMDAGEEGTGRTGGHSTGVDERADAEAAPNGGTGRVDELGNDNRVSPEFDRSKSREVAEAQNRGDEKVPYRAKSQGFSLQSVMPTSAASATYEVLSQFDDIDEYVREKLGYESKEEMWKHLAAEQVDGVALSIKTMDDGLSMIIGDQTGLGKGRQAASLIRYGVKQGKKPIFFTQKPKLFSDLYRDMEDTGNEKLRPLIINAKRGMVVGGTVKLEPVIDENTGEQKIDEETGEPEFEEVIEGGRTVYSHNKKDVDKFLQTGEVPEGYDYVVVTYSQIQGTTGNYEKRKTALLLAANNNLVIMDESHTAAGKSNTGEYMGQIVSASDGVTFLSATFAKNPECMPLYAIRSVIANANISKSDLIKAIKKGGVPLQSIMSEALTRSGAMIRRERDMTGVVVDWKPMDTEPTGQRIVYDDVIETFRRVTDFQRKYIMPIIEKIRQNLDEHQLLFIQGNRSRLYNIVNQMTVAIKTEGVIEEALAALKRGEKPYISLAETNASMMDDFFEPGTNIEKYDIAMTLSRCLDKCFNYMITTVDEGDKTKARYTLGIEELSDEGRAEYDAIKQYVENMQTGLPLSPIDAIKEALRREGYSVEEITGRDNQVEIDEDGGYVYSKRQKGNVDSIVGDYNSNKTDVLIINKSGSTGLSIHNSGKFETIDGKHRKRHHITLQPQSDTNDEAQMRGRGDRTGQLSRCLYTYVISHIPAEHRIMMMLKKKLASLDANTTSSAKSEFNEVDTVDFGNKYGSQVIVDILKGHSEWYLDMEDPLGLRKQGMSDIQVISALQSYVAKAEDYNKVMKRVGMLLTSEQEEFYEDVFSAYDRKIEELNSANENDLEIKNIPLDAQTLQITEYTKGENPGGENVFADSAYIEEVDANVMNKPYNQQELESVINTTLDGKSEEEYKQGILDKIEAYRKEQLAKIEEQYAKNLEQRKATIKKNLDKKVASDREKYEKSQGEQAAQGEQKGKPKGKQWTQEEYDAELKRLNEEAEKSVEQNKDLSLRSVDSRCNVLSRYVRDLKLGTYHAPLVTESKNDKTQLQGVVVGFKISDSFSPKTSFVRFATTDGTRMKNIPFNDYSALNSMASDDANAGSALSGNFGRNIVKEWDSFAHTSGDGREKRYIITGNLLSAIYNHQQRSGNKPLGQITTFTTKDGEVRTGILLPKGVNLSQFGKQVPLIEAFEKISRGMRGETVTTADGTFTFKCNSSRYTEYRLSIKKTNKKADAILSDDRLASLVKGHNVTEARTYWNGTENKQLWSITISRDDNLENVLKYLSGEPYNMTYNSDLSFEATPRDNDVSDYKMETKYEFDDSIESLFDKWNTDEYNKRMAGIVFPIAKKLGMTAVFGDTETKETGGWYDEEHNQIKLKYNFFAYNLDKNYKAEVLLHETIHSVTVYAIRAKKMGMKMSPELEKAVEELEAIYATIKNEPSVKAQYGGTNIFEMLAELANKEFRETLASMNFLDKVYKKLGNLLRALFDMVGISKKTTVLDRVEDALQRMYDNFDIDLYREVEKKIQEIAERAKNGSELTEVEKSMIEKSNMLIGENGVERIKDDLEKFEIQFNMALAESMKADGKSDLEIKIATGCEFGKDGKIRYETIDPGNKIEKLPLDDIDKLTKLAFMPGSTSSDRLLAMGASRALKNPGISYNAGTLDGVLEDDKFSRQLFEMYPNLKNTKVRFVFDKNGDRGSHWRGGNEIKINLYNFDASVLYHEIQHAIQHEEGFARGSLQERRFTREEYAISEEAYRRRRKYDAFDKAEGELRQYASQLGIEYYQLLRIMADVSREEVRNNEHYRNSASENESTAVENRHFFTPEQKRNSLSSDNEKVWREEQELYFADSRIEYSLRTKPAPKETGIGYKVFYKGKDGKLYPPMVANPNGADTPVGVWLDADAAPVVGQTKTGRNQVKAGGKGTQGGSGNLAYRPGWHLGEIPYALQFNRKDENGNKTLFPKDFVWAEVEYAKDVDYQSDANNAGINKNGKYQHSLAGLPYLPTDGYYKYRTNPNPETDPWIITGAMKVNRVLSDKEVDDIVKNAGREPQRREGLNRYSNKEIVLNGEKYDVAELENSLREEVETKLEELGYDNVSISGVRLIGSRINGTEREDSDLDLLVEFDGDASEDGLFNALNEDGIEVNGIKVDVNPITPGKSGTIEQFMKRNAGFSKSGERYRSAEGLSLESDATEDVKTALNETADRLGQKVHVVESLEDIPNEYARRAIESGRSMAYYDVRTGEVYVYAPSVPNVNEARKTVLHEMLGHKGLRQAIGEERYDAEMAKLYGMLPVEQRKAVMRKMMRMAHDARMSGEHMRGRRFLVEAMDEWLAESAERYDEAPTWFEKVVSAIRQMLRDFGMEVELTENDVRYMLWRSHETLRNGGRRTIGSAARDLIMRERFGIGMIDGTDPTDPTTPNGGGRNVRYRESQPPTPMNATTAGVEYGKRVLGGWNKFKEAHIDSLRSVEKLQKAIAKETGEAIKDSENAYNKALALSSKNAHEMREFKRYYVDPLIEATANIVEAHPDIDNMQIETYLIAKHGLERNEVFARRDAKRMADEKYDEQIEAAMNAGDMAEVARLQQEKQDFEDTAYENNRLTDYSGLTGLFVDEAAGEKKEDLKVADAEARAEQYVTDFEGKIGDELRDNLWDRIDAMRMAGLEKSKNTGMISVELYNQLKDQFKWYVPLRDFDNDTAEDLYEYISNPVLGQPFVKKAKGRTSVAGKILANLMNMGQSAIHQGNRNMVNLAMLRLAEQHPTKLLTSTHTYYRWDDVKNEWVIEAPDMESAAYQAADEEGKAQIIADWEKDMLDKCKNEPDRYKKCRRGFNPGIKVKSASHASQHMLTVRRNGLMYNVFLNGAPDAMQAVKGSNLVEPPVKTLAALTQFKARTVTAMNPDFVISNFWRDFVSANEVSFIKYGGKYQRKFLANVIGMTMMGKGTLAGRNHSGKGAFGRIKGETADVMMRGVLGLYQKYYDGTLDETPYDPSNPSAKDDERLFSEFLRNGGQTGFSQMVSVDRYDKKVKEAILRAQGKRNKKMAVKEIVNVTGAMTAAEALADIQERFNEAIENTCRFAAYKTSRQMGRSVDQSIMDAKEVSVNFNRRGSGAMGNAFLRSYWMFFNASIQGFVQRIKLITDEDPAARRRAMAVYGAQIAAGIAITAFGIMVVAMMMGGDGDDDDKDAVLDNPYFRINEFRRRNSIIIPAPIRNTFLRIDLSHEDAALYGLGVITAEYMYANWHHKGNYGLDEYLADVAGQLSQALPVDAISDELGVGNEIKHLSKQLRPSVLSPVFDISDNEDFLGNRINWQTDYNKGLPEWQRVSQRNRDGLLNKGIEKMNRALGGTENRRSWLERTMGDYAPNADNIDYVMRNTLGGLYQFPSQIAKTLSNLYEVHDGNSEAARDRDMLRDVPLVNRLVMTTSTDYAKMRAANDEFDYYMGMIEDVETEERNLRRNKKSGYYGKDGNGGKAAIEAEERRIAEKEEQRYVRIWEKKRGAQQKSYKQMYGEMKKEIKKRMDEGDEKGAARIKEKMNELKRRAIREWEMSDRER